MKTLRFRALPLFAFATFFLAACGDDDPTGPADSLTDAEITALVDALFSMTLDPELPEDDGTGLLFTAAATVTFPIDETVPCTLGGSIRMRGSVKVTVDENEESGSYEHTVDQVHQNCVVKVAGVTESFRFTGAPSIKSTVEAEIEDEEITEFEGSEVGTVRWTLGSREGRCDVDLDYVIPTTPPANPSYKVTGKVCGKTVDRTITLQG